MRTRFGVSLRIHHEPLVELGRALLRQGYSFITPTPETHRRANRNAEARGRARGSSLRDVFGWNRPFDQGALPSPLLSLLRDANALDVRQDDLRSRVRFSTLGGRAFAHGSYPTVEDDAVFFGPDTYRFCSLITSNMVPCARVADIGCGSGAGGIVASRFARDVVLSDINDSALALARVNAAIAGLERVEAVRSDVLASVDGSFDCIVANPPYLADAAARAYRHGGDDLGSELSLRIARESLDRLAPGGRLILYTGAAIVDGVDVIQRGLLPLLTERGATYTYEEIDPDVFGEELDLAAYQNVDRIAAVGLVAVMPMTSGAR